MSSNIHCTPSVAHVIQNKKRNYATCLKNMRSNNTHSANSVNCYCKVVVSNGSTASFNGPHWFTRELKRICVNIKENIKHRLLLGKGGGCLKGWGSQLLQLSVPHNHDIPVSSI